MISRRLGSRFGSSVGRACGSDPRFLGLAAAFGFGLNLPPSFAFAFAFALSLGADWPPPQEGQNQSSSGIAASGGFRQVVW
jgi:hypothetical protein